MGLRCLNCKQVVERKEAKVFAGVFVCPACFLAATRLEQRGTDELQKLLTMQREAIRIALIDGKLPQGPAPPLQDVSKKEVLEAILKQQEARDDARIKRTGH